MSNIDKFSLPLKNGFNSLQQISEINRNHEGLLHAIVSYVDIKKAPNGAAIIDKKGFHHISENEIDSFRIGYSRAPIDMAYLEMINDLEATFNMVREGETSLEKINAQLKEKSEAFLELYYS